MTRAVNSVRHGPRLRRRSSGCAYFGRIGADGTWEDVIGKSERT